jgi:hypothetical protein
MPIASVDNAFKTYTSSSRNQRLAFASDFRRGGASTEREMEARENSGMEAAGSVLCVCPVELRRGWTSQEVWRPLV